MSIKSTILGLGLSTLALAYSAPSEAAPLLFDQNVTPTIIFGSGNANGGFTIDQNNGVELGLRAKIRFDVSDNAPKNIFNSNGDGTYNHAKGQPPDTNPPKPGWWVGRDAARWSFEWSINTNWDNSTSFNLADLTYELGLDSDASQGKSFSVFDPVNVLVADHGIGNNSTANGVGDDDNPRTNAEYATLISGNNVAQNSWNMAFFGPDFQNILSFDPDLDGHYSFYLAAFDGVTKLAQTEITVIVGAGGAPVPEPSTLLLLGTGLVGLIAYRRRA